MFIRNGKDFFETEDFPRFIGYRIYKSGCPECCFSDKNKYCFLKGDILEQAIIKSPFYVKLFVYFTRKFNKIFSKK